MSRLLFAALAVVCFLVPAYGQTTTIADHLQLAASAPNQAPTPVIGKIKISYPAFTDVNGQFYAAASQIVTIAPDGSFSTALPASDTSTKQGDDAAGGLDYSVTYYAASSGVVVSTDQWFVRASATPLTIADVTMHSSNPPLSYDPKGSAAAAQAASLQKSANLSDLASIASAKTNLGLSTVASTGRFEDLVDAPQLASVASTGKYSDLTGLPTIPSKTSDLTNDSNFLTSGTVAPVAISGAYADLTGKPSLATVATTGSYNDLTNKPTLSFDASGAAAQVLASSLQKSANLTDLTDVSAARTALALSSVAHSGAYADLTGKPTLAPVAASGSYNDLANLPTIPSKTSQLTNDSSFVATSQLSTVATTGAYADLTGKPALAAVATSGLFTDLSGRPTISTVGSTGNYSDLLGAPVLSTVATSGKYVDLSGKPALATVATSGLYGDLLNAPTVPTKVSDLANDAGYVAASSLATVATTGAYADLSGKPALNFDATGTAAAVQAASLQKTANLSDVPDKAAARTALGLAPVASTGAYGDLTGKPTFATVATTGSFSDLLNQPTIPSKTSQLTNDSSFVKTTDLSTVATTGAYADLTGKPTLASVATSGLYTDLSGKPTISTAGSTGNYSDLLGKPVLSTVATSGAYADLSGKPTLSLVSSTGLYTDLIGAPAVPTKTSQLTNDAGFAVAASLATVASTGSYADLSNKPALNFDATGTAAAVQAASLQKSANLSDVVNAATARTNLGLAAVSASGSYTDLTNKPSLSAVALSGSYADLLNSPAIPSKTSQLTNDAGFAVASTLSAVATTGSYTDLSNKPSIPTKVSDLTNDAGYVNATTAPVVSVNGLTGAVALSFLTPGNNLSDLTNVTTAQTNLHIAAVGVSGSYADLVNKPTLGTASSHPLADFVLTAQINQANGVAGLGASSQVDVAQIPSLTLAKISDAGTAASHLATDFLLTSALGTTVAPLDGSKLVPLANIPAIPYSSLANAPTLATVATSGSYTDLLNKPAGLPPIGACGGDLGGAYPNCTVVGFNATNLANLGVGMLKLTTGGIPALVSNSDITTALTFVPMNPANNLSELTDQALARTHLGLGSIASMNALSFLADNGTNGIPFRTSPGTTRVTTGSDLVTLLGYQPVNPSQLGVTIATLDGTTHKLTASQLPPVDWSDVTNAPSFVLTSDIGTTVAPLVSGKVPVDNLPAQQVATATSQGIANFPTAGGLLVSSGAVSVDRSQFDAAGSATAATASALQKSANLSDLANAATARQNLQLATVAASGSYNDLANKPSLSAVALSGAYADLTGKPSIPSKVSDLTNDLGFALSSSLATVATSGQFADLKNIPLIPTKTSQLANDSSFVVSSALSAVATSGNYSDLHGTPTLATVATTGSYTDLVNVPAAPTISTVGHTGQYSDLLNAPPLGTIASHNIGDFVSVGAVGANSGVAPLDQTGHVPFLNLSVGIPGGIATLDGNSRLSQNQIPTSGIAATAIGTGAVSNTAYGYLANVTSDIQAQLNGTLKMTSGATGGLVYYDGSTNVLQSVNSSSSLTGIIPAKMIADGSVTNAEFGYLDGATSNIQAQITAISAAVGLLNTGSLNNPKLTTWNSALGKTGTSLQHMAVVGDSLSCCYGVTNVNDVWPRRVQDTLQSQFGNGGSGMLPMTQGTLVSGATSAWWTYSGGTPGFPQGGIGPYQDSGINNGGAFASMITMAPGLTATTTQSYYGNQVKVWVLSSSSTAPLTVLVDGSSVGTCGTTTGGDFETPVCSFNVTAGNHTVALQAPATNQAIVYGAQILNSTGIDVINVSHIGAEASAFTANISSNLAPVDYVQSSEGGIGLVVIELGANEMLDQTSISTLTTNLTTLVNHFKSYSPVPSIVIWDYNWFVGGYTNQAAYHTAIQQFAASNGLPLVSMDEYWGETTAQTNGLLYSDNAHMNDAGHAVAASVFMNLVDSSTGGFGTNGGNTGSTGGTNGGLSFTVAGGSGDFPGFNINTDAAKWTLGSSGSSVGNSGNLAGDLWIADENSRKISFVVGSSGNVGIGLGVAGSVSEPAAALEVSDKNGTQSSVPLRITSTSTTGYDGIDFFPPGAGTGGVPQWRIAVGAFSNPTFNNSLLIYDDGANQAVRMQIDYNGNVGIGTPAESTIPYLFSVGQKSGSPTNPVFAVQSDGTVSGLQYYANSQAGVTASIVDGSCTITVTGGLITGHSGC